MMSLRRSSGGFTLVEVLVATALLGFSLVVMFGFHSQAVRSNVQARKITDCTYLAQDQLEELVALEWTTATGRPSVLATNAASTTSAWDPLFYPSSGALPNPINAVGEVDGSESAGHPKATYYITWDVGDMTTATDDWIRIRVRCSWQDARFGTWNGTTISTYRFRDA
ncbi:MAG: prepilin-type N-terminal cleavage/methylation domain-containing protein [Alphaproteobacteria bacterium]|nr:prepilin-type N-terminal cleavage/methylation domain-containing protein [Alphaproteobacteria bacterium]MCB9792626.1 prepilin-type N-terminal cleavage/methylation domain-containing protein [Alphaproteobacteria bacterium]